jgi:hypothetical protein
MSSEVPAQETFSVFNRVMTQEQWECHDVLDTFFRRSTPLTEVTVELQDLLYRILCVKFKGSSVPVELIQLLKKQS